MHEAYNNGDIEIRWQSLHIYTVYNWQGVEDPETVANHVTHEGYIYKQLQSSFGSREAQSSSSIRYKISFGRVDGLILQV